MSALRVVIVGVVIETAVGIVRAGGPLSAVGEIKDERLAVASPLPVLVVAYSTCVVAAEDGAVQSLSNVESPVDSLNSLEEVGLGEVSSG